MKQKVLYLLTLAVLAIGFVSCEKKSEGLTLTTYYAVIDLEGGDLVIQKGTPYVEPGFSASMAGEDVTDQVIVDDNIDINTSGKYFVTYSVVNEDGFASTVTRTVTVLDLTDPVEGFYKLTPASYRIYDGGAPTAYKGAFEFLVIGLGNDVYEVEDLMGGWYSQGAGYGSAYNMNASIQLNPDGTIDLIDSYVAGWGDSADDFQNGFFDASTNTLSYQVFYAGVIEFGVTATKIEL